ncbi:hypothetical protein [Marinobacter arenosus]|uniref:hypothetical protein n=1 Tax=Marinobacter arenosus TaxID=2856822 RepID=UPI001C4D6892|nr:hypothetical protein [Marinobacter arenosus]MBW0145896.1 hypothetical protein [Marinobacter arenosus]
MRLWLLLAVVVFTGCDNTTLTAAPNFSLFETSAGVVYLINQNTGELKVIPTKHVVVINAGDIFEDDEGHFFQYIGDGQVERVDEPEALVQKHSD